MENDTKYHKPTTHTLSLYEHPSFNNFIVRIDLLAFAKPLKVILTERFVLIKQN